MCETIRTTKKIVHTKPTIPITKNAIPTPVNNIPTTNKMRENRIPIKFPADIDYHPNIIYLFILINIGKIVIKYNRIILSKVWVERIIVSYYFIKFGGTSPSNPATKFLAPNIAIFILVS